MTTMTVKLNKDEETLFNNYSEKSGLSVSTLLKKALMNQIEDEYD
ncbi:MULTISPECIES: ribbon-helix-helix domain-containing protein [unclassified Staphylococcus]|nr:MULTISPECIES: ribbon-helix-helix domain-containing protein [unclassified Staphylococcus]UXR71051.1 ribbon-helix-helix domain-containing protein [Staphylococcus sp. IVB6240]UXR73277.1 ribbon-helix-helix domain-containing protein [Staphylococcus sp. IVB6238]UXR75577.1 ribbon-helix-helix domain-containing protein [Staphylococcus sp. IVB6233]UXR79778.1 ribbon-helix-helix domain-containing protein [Staphylococcus sp. IVB6218]